ncbi:unnamed protein product [Blepharisma stoltei]|uniref:DUF4378 domain-containing protein n=1 Tax=Blepharisma stoltei TaxID=1481888 RepID=A0AAU9JUK9_9CILI|nr:unnamed protein product [Blepharisma stoltei]
MKNQEDVLFAIESQKPSSPKFILNLNTNGNQNNSSLVTGKKIKSCQALPTKKSLSKKPENLLKTKPQLKKSETNIILKDKISISKETSPAKIAPAVKSIPKRFKSPPEPKIEHEISPKPWRSKSSKRDRKIQLSQPKQIEIEAVKEKPASGKIKKIINETLTKNHLEKSLNIKKEEEIKKKEEEKKNKLKKANEAIRKQNAKKITKEKKLHKLAWGVDQSKFENKEYERNAEEIELKEKKRAERERSLNERRAHIGLDLYPNIRPRRKSPKIEKPKETHWSPDPNIQKYMKLKRKEVKIAELQSRLEELVKEKERERALEMIDKQRKSAVKKTKKKKKKKILYNNIQEYTKKRLLSEPLSQSEYINPMSLYRHESDPKKSPNHKINNLSAWKIQTDSDLSDIAVHPYGHESLEDLKVSDSIRDSQGLLKEKLKNLQERVLEAKQLMHDKYSPDKAAIIIQRWFRSVLKNKIIEEIEESYQSHSSEDLAFSSSLLNSLFTKKNIEPIEIESFPHHEELTLQDQSSNSSNFSLKRQETERDEEWIDIKDPPPESLKNSKSELVDQFRLTLQNRFNEIEQKFLDNEIMVQAQLDELGSVGENSIIKTGGTESSSSLRTPCEVQSTPEVSDRERQPVKIPPLPIGKIAFKIQKYEESEASNEPYINVHEEYEEPIYEEGSSSRKENSTIENEISDEESSLEERDHADSSDREIFSPRIEWISAEKPSSHRLKDFTADEAPEPDKSEQSQIDSLENSFEYKVNKKAEEVCTYKPKTLDLRAMLGKHENNWNLEKSSKEINEQPILKNNEKESAVELILNGPERELQKGKIDSEIRKFVSEKVTADKLPLQTEEKMKPYKPEIVQNIYEDRIMRTFQEKQKGDTEPKKNSANRYDNFVKVKDTEFPTNQKHTDAHSDESEEDLWIAGSSSYKVPQESPSSISSSSKSPRPFVSNVKIPQNIKPNIVPPPQESPKQLNSIGFLQDSNKFLNKVKSLAESSAQIQNSPSSALKSPLNIPSTIFYENPQKIPDIPKLPLENIRGAALIKSPRIENQKVIPNISNGNKLFLNPSPHPQEELPCKLPQEPENKKPSQESITKGILLTDHKELFCEKPDPSKEGLNKDFILQKKIPGLSESDKYSVSSSDREYQSVPSLENLHEGNASPLNLETDTFDKDESSDDSDLDIMKRIRSHIEEDSSESDRKFSPFSKKDIFPLESPHGESENSLIDYEHDTNSLESPKDIVLTSINTTESDDFTEEFINQVIHKEVWLYLQKVPFQDISPQIDPSLTFIDEYLDVMLSQLFPIENEILDSINTPAYHDPLSRLSLLQNAEIGSLVKYPTLDLILPPELCTELKSGFNSLDAPSRQIYLQMLFDCVNEALNYIRPYDTKGIPDPWSTHQRTLFGESHLINVFEKVKETMYKWACLRGGIYPTIEMIMPNGGIDENRLQVFREEKMSGLLCQDVHEEENSWLDYEEEEVQVKLDLADMVLEVIVVETIKLLQIK